MASSVGATVTTETDEARLDPYQTFRRTKMFSALNGIRCCCALGVVKLHSEWVTPSIPFFNHGNLGVDMFFVISGFLIVTLLLRERDRNGTISLKQFYARRTLRIFPIYYALILGILFALYVVAHWKPNGFKFYLPVAAVLLTYTTNIIPVPSLGIFYHCWSLSMEEQFYLVWPALEKRLSRRFTWLLLAVALVFNQLINYGVFKGLIVRIYGDPQAWKMPLYLITFTPIILGVILAHLLHHRKSFLLMYRLLGYRWSPLLFLIIVFAIISNLGPTYQGTTRLALHVALMLGLASVVIREDHWMRPLLTFPPVARVGVISYGVYLYHVVIMELTTRLTHGRLSPMVTFFVVSAIAIVVADFSYRFFESRFLSLRQRFSTAGMQQLRPTGLT